MSLKLNDIVASLVKASPPGEIAAVGKGLSTILPENNAVIDNAIEKHIQEIGAVYSSKYIVSKWNKSETSSKYIDHINNKAFNIDISTQSVIDLEHHQSTTPSYFDSLVKSLKVYGEDHYPSNYTFTVSPQLNDLHIILIGHKINQDNFFTGQWKSHYILSNGKISGQVSLDIHYYEEGNVRLHFDENVDSALISYTATDIVNFINNSENKITYKIVENFNELNQKYFKNLRRLLPVTRSKINWGNAIGNYRLGADVVNKN